MVAPLCGRLVGTGRIARAVLAGPPASGFVAQRGDLLQRYPNEYVAIHQGDVVGHGSNKIAVALQAYREHGRVAIYVGFVSEVPPVPARQPTFRSFTGDASR